MKLRCILLFSLVTVLAVALSVFDVESGIAQDRPVFTEAQKIGYLGRTSRSAIARTVYQRLKNQTIARSSTDTTDRIRVWHEIVLDSVAIDHTPDPDTGDVDFVQGGPTRTSRALAMTQIAVFDAVNAFELNFVPYNDIGSVGNDVSIDAAIAYASFTVQLHLFPDQSDRLESLLQSDLDQIDAMPNEIEAGKKLGELSANSIINGRQGDNSKDPEPDFGEGGRVSDGTTTVNNTPVNGGTTQVFEWEPDPLTPPASGDFNLALGAYWGGVTPFSLETGHQFRLADPPTPGSFDYLLGYYLVQFIGASTDTPGSLSNPITRFVGNFWGYDATPLLGTPPRLYNQIAVKAAKHQLTEPDEMARFLALINTGLADSGIAAWDSKYYYNYWRPVTGIRRDDGVFLTDTNETWKPVGISVINTELAITPTPPFPAYPSGHATFGACTFEIMRQFFGNDTRFTFVSDEYNGQGVDPLGVSRPLVPVRFRSLDSAQRSNGISRIYNGVHWQWDNLGGQALGERIGQYLMDSEDAFQPAR